MTAGTKVTLALVAVLILALALYYSSLSPEKGTDIAVDVVPEVQPPPADRTSPEVGFSPGPRRPSITPPRETPVQQGSTGRFLGDSVESALADEFGESIRRPLGDREPVVVGATPGEGGGKDGPEASPPVATGSAEPPNLDALTESESDSPAQEPKPAEEPEPAPEQDTEPVPEPAPAPQALPEPPPYTEYTVMSGDSMSSIARDWFGTDAKWDLIAKANPLIDPNRLRVGQVLRLPPKDTERDDAGEAAGPSGTTYVVRSGDTLSRIARQYYGDESKWRIIHDANRDKIGDNPDNLRVGMRLEIPPAPQPAEE